MPLDSSTLASPSLTQVGTLRGAACWIMACTSSWRTTRSSAAGVRIAPPTASRMRPSYSPPAQAGARVTSWNCLFV